MSKSENINISHWCSVKQRKINLNTATYKECPHGCGWTLEDHIEKTKNANLTNASEIEDSSILGKKIGNPELKEVYFRKLQLVGGTTFTLSLPPKICKTLKLVKGDTTKIHLEGKHIILEFYEDDK